MVILADRNRREIGPIKKANLTVKPNGKDKEKTFSIQIARCYWTEEMCFSNYIYIPGTEFGGIIGEILTYTTLDYVELKGYTWRGLMQMKVIKPPSDTAYQVVSGELNTVLRSMIEPRFSGLFVVPEKETGVTVTNYQFDRFCTLLGGCMKMLNTVKYRLHIEYRKDVQTLPGYVYVEAVPVVDYSSQIELSKDSRLQFTMDKKRNGVNHLIVTGKGELLERNVLDLYAWPDGSIKTEQYYTGIDEIEEVYENTSTETSDLRNSAEEKFRELMSKDTFSMNVEKLGIDVEIGDIVGARDYLTGMYMSKPIENIIYDITGGVVSKTYKLEGEDE